jgi:hypothetical protein
LISSWGCGSEMGTRDATRGHDPIRVKLSSIPVRIGHCGAGIFSSKLRKADSETNLVMRATNEIASSQKTLLAMTLHYSF